MPRKKASELASAQGRKNEMSRIEAGRRSRARVQACWDTVWRMLTDPVAPRRDHLGRDVFEIWCDQVLNDPAGEIARVMRDLMPPETLEKPDNPMITSVQSLYLVALRSANERAQLIEARATPDADERSTVNGHSER